MISKALDEVSEADLMSLVTSRVAEGRSLEFKRGLPGGSDTDIKEFLADVTSLANAQGGDLILGIEEEEGVASEVCGMPSIDVDAIILRLENLLRDGIEPRLSAVRMRWIDLASSHGVLAIRVPGSLASPHRVRFKNSGRFYNRNSRGKYEMDTHELRVAFTASEQMPAKLRELHTEAVKAATGAGFPFRVHEGPTAVVSVMPLTFLRETRDIDLSRENVIVPPRVGGGLNYLHMLEGLVMSTPENDGSVRSYALTHRTGRVDAAWSIGAVRENNGTTMNLVWAKYFREGLIDVLRAATTRLKSYGIEGPWVIFVTVFGLKGFWMFLSQHDHSEPAWRDQATLPELVVENPSEEALQPVLSAFPLLFGIPSSQFRYPQ